MSFDDEDYCEMRERVKIMWWSHVINTILQLIAILMKLG